MSDISQSPDPGAGGRPGLIRWLPALRSRWWTAVLGASLMLNLGVGGMILGHAIESGPRERLMGASYVQLVPRRFFHGLPRERRRALMEIVRKSRPDLRALREANEQISLKLADALSAPDYREEDVAQVVAEFSGGSQNLATRGGAVVMEIARLLTAEERQALAAAIRARAGKK